MYQSCQNLGLNLSSKPKLSRKGQIWFDNTTFEIIGDVALTNADVNVQEEQKTHNVFHYESKINIFHSF